MTDFRGSSYFVMIPVEVSRNKKLLERPKAIILFGEIYTMLNATGKFFMSNSTLCDRLGCKPTAMKAYLNLLEEEGYIKRSVVYDEQTKRIKGREITLGSALGHGNDLGRQSDQGRVAETTGVGSPERPGEGRGNDHKYISIRDQKKRSEEVPTGSRPKKAKRDSKIYTEILDYLNDKTGRTGKSRFKDCPANRILIDGLLDMKAKDRYYAGQPYTVEDFKEVIDKKTTEWKGTGLTFSSGKLAEEYLQPSTLFAKKNFYNYLMQQTSRISSGNDSPEYQNLFAQQPEYSVETGELPF